MLTFTMGAMGSLKNEFDYVSSRWCRVRAWLFKWFREFSYLKVLEVTRKGRPHLHVLLSGNGCNRIETEDLYSPEGKRMFYGLRSAWGFFVKVRKTWKSFSASSYVVKYLNKCMLGVRDIRYAALLFASNKRMWSISRDLAVPQKKREPRGFVMDGVVNSSDFDVYLREHGLVPEETDYLEAQVDRRFPELFGWSE